MISFEFFWWIQFPFSVDASSGEVTCLAFGDYPLALVPAQISLTISASISCELENLIECSVTHLTKFSAETSSPKLRRDYFCLQGDPSGWSQPPVDIKTKVAFSMRSIYWNVTFVLMSTGVWDQSDGSPCTSDVEALNEAMMQSSNITK